MGRFITKIYFAIDNDIITLLNLSDIKMNRSIRGTGMTDNG